MQPLLAAFSKIALCSPTHLLGLHNELRTLHSAVSQQSPPCSMVKKLRAQKAALLQQQAVISKVRTR